MIYLKSSGSVPGPGGFGSGAVSPARDIVTGGGGGGGGGKPSPPPFGAGLRDCPRRLDDRFAADFFFAGARFAAVFLLTAPRFAAAFFLVPVFLRGDLRATFRDDLRLGDLRRPPFVAGDFLRDDFLVAFFLPALRAAIGTLL